MRQPLTSGAGLRAQSTFRPGRRRRPAGGEKNGRRPAARVPRGSDRVFVWPSAPSCWRTTTPPPLMPMSGYPPGTPSGRAQPPDAFPDGRRPPGHTFTSTVSTPSIPDRLRAMAGLHPSLPPRRPGRPGRRRGRSRPYPDAVVPPGVEVPAGPGEPPAVPMSRPSQSLPAAPPTGMSGRSRERYAAPGNRSAVPARRRRHEPSGLRHGAPPARMRAPDLPGWAAAIWCGA